MGKPTVQIRVPEDLAHDLGIIAAAFDKTLAKYVEAALREVAQRDFPHALKVAKERAEANKKRQHHQEEEGGKE
jgi:hypothetical protein